nr:hypothetical protein [Tanacetum cinerariifolium]
MKDKLSAHQETISILSKQKEAQIKLYKTQKDQELDKVIELENKVKVLDNIVYKTGQSVQTMNMLNNKCRTSFAKPEFLKKAQRANPRPYDIGVELCKQKITNRTYIGYIYPFIQSTIESNFCPVISRISAGLNQFLRCLIEEMVADLRYFNSLEFEVDYLKSQLETQKTQFLNKIDRLSKEYYYADHMNAILGVYTELDEVTNLQYKWKPKSGQENVNPNVSMPLGNASSTANVMDPMTSRRSTVSNTPLSSNFFAARRDCPIHRRLWRRIQRETNRSKNHSYKSSAYRSDGHRPNGAHMRPPLRSSGPRPHGDSMRPSFRPAGHIPHGPSMNPRRPTMN